jgi:hypothetical protein
LESSVVIRTSRARGDKRAGQHTVESLHAHLTKEPDFRELRQTIGVIRVRLVRRHIKRRFSMTCIDADRRQPFGAERMIKPYRQRSGLEHDSLYGRRPLADELGDDSGIRYALAAPDPFTCSADRDYRLFHRHVETDIFFHGCSPFDAWARRPVVSPYFHPIGEQPPASIVGWD